MKLLTLRLECKSPTTATEFERCRLRYNEWSVESDPPSDLLQVPGQLFAINIHLASLDEFERNIALLDVFAQYSFFRSAPKRDVKAYIRQAQRALARLSTFLETVDVDSA